MGVPFCRPSLASQRLAVSVCHALASYSIGCLAKRNGDAFIGNHCIPINLHTNDTPCQRQPTRHRCAALSTACAPTICRIVDSPRVNDAPHYRQPTRQRKRQLHSVWAHAVTETPCSARPHCHTGKATQVRAQTEPLTRKRAQHRKRSSTVDLRTGEVRVPFCRPSLASQRLAVPVCHALAS